MSKRKQVEMVTLFHLTFAEYLPLIKRNGLMPSPLVEDARDEDEDNEFWVVCLWESMAAVRFWTVGHLSFICNEEDRVNIKPEKYSDYWIVTVTIPKSYIIANYTWMPFGWIELNVKRVPVKYITKIEQFIPTPEEVQSLLDGKYLDNPNKIK